MARLKEITRQFIRGLDTPRRRWSLYDFAVVSLAVWLLGGLAVMVRFSSSAKGAAGKPLAIEAHHTSVQQLQQFKRELDDAEGAYQRATAGLNDAVVEHALHRQALNTFLARHFRDFGAEAVFNRPTEAPATMPNPRWLAINRAFTTLISERRAMLERVSPAHPRVLELETRLFEARSEMDGTPQQIPYDEGLALESAEVIAVSGNKGAAGWGSRRQASYLVTTEGPSATYQIPSTPESISRWNSAMNEQQRYQDLETAAQASARLLEIAVVGERNAWGWLQEAISVCQAAKHVSAGVNDGLTPHEAQLAAEKGAAINGMSSADSAFALGLAAMTALAVAAGYLFMRKAQSVRVADPRVVGITQQLTAQLGLPVIGTVPAPASWFAESRRRLAALARRRQRVDYGRFGAETVLGGVLLMWAMLALLQPGFANRFFDEPASAVAEVASRL